MIPPDSSPSSCTAEQNVLRLLGQYPIDWAALRVLIPPHFLKNSRQRRVHPYLFFQLLEAFGTLGLKGLNFLLQQKVDTPQQIYSWWASACGPRATRFTPHSLQAWKTACSRLFELSPHLAQRSFPWYDVLSEAFAGHPAGLKILLQLTGSQLNPKRIIQACALSSSAYSMFRFKNNLAPSAQLKTFRALLSTGAIDQVYQDLSLQYFSRYPIRQKLIQLLWLKGARPLNKSVASFCAPALYASGHQKAALNLFSVHSLGKGMPPQLWLPLMYCLKADPVTDREAADALFIQAIHKTQPSATQASQILKLLADKGRFDLVRQTLVLLKTTPLRFNATHCASLFSILRHASEIRVDCLLHLSALGAPLPLDHIKLRMALSDAEVSELEEFTLSKESMVHGSSVKQRSL